MHHGCLSTKMVKFFNSMDNFFFKNFLSKIDNILRHFSTYVVITQKQLVRFCQIKFTKIKVYNIFKERVQIFLMRSIVSKL